MTPAFKCIRCQLDASKHIADTIDHDMQWPKSPCKICGLDYTQHSAYAQSNHCWETVDLIKPNGKDFVDNTINQGNEAVNTVAAKTKKNNSTTACIKCRGEGHTSNLHGKALFIVPDRVFKEYYQGKYLLERFEDAGFCHQSMNGKKFFYEDVTYIENTNEWAVNYHDSADMVEFFQKYRAFLETQKGTSTYVNLLLQAYAGLMERLVFDSIFSRSEMTIVRKDTDGIVQHLLQCANNTELSELDFNLLAFIDARLNNNIINHDNSKSITEELVDDGLTQSPVTGVKP